MTIGIPGGHFFICHLELVERFLSKKFKTFQKKKNFLSEKEKSVIEC